MARRLLTTDRVKSTLPEKVRASFGTLAVDADERESVGEIERATDELDRIRSRIVPAVLREPRVRPPPGRV
jgi:hypothetical protein